MHTRLRVNKTDRHKNKRSAAEKQQDTYSRERSTRSVYLTSASRTALARSCLLSHHRFLTAFHGGKSKLAQTIAKLQQPAPATTTKQRLPSAGFIAADLPSLSPRVPKKRQFYDKNAIHQNKRKSIPQRGQLLYGSRSCNGERARMVVDLSHFFCSKNK